MISKISRIFLYQFIALLPFRIDALLASSDIYSSGFFSPYLNQFFYLSDLFFLLSLLFVGISFVFGEGIKLKFSDFSQKSLILLALFVLFSFFVPTWHSLRILQFFVLFLFLIAGFLDWRKISYFFVGAMVLVSVVGILQYFFQSSLELGFLGESVLSTDLPGVAKFSVFGAKMIRAYGTFGHPNIFAGYLLFAIVLAFQEFHGVLRILLPAFFLTALFLTFSLSAFLAFLLGCIVYFLLSHNKIRWKYVLAFAATAALLIFISGLGEVLFARVFDYNFEGFSERRLFSSISWEMFLDKPFGVGLGNFTQEMQNYTANKLFAWNYQPVHNTFLLILNELGLQGLLIFLLFFVSLWKKGPAILAASWLILLIIIFFDHYLISLYQGQALLFLWMAWFMRRDLGSH